MSSKLQLVRLVLRWCVILAPWQAQSQTPGTPTREVQTQRRIDSLIRVVLRDTSSIQRAVALDLVRRSPAPQRRSAAEILAQTLADPSRAMRGLALNGIGQLQLGSDAASVLAQVSRIAADSNDNLRVQAIGILGSSPSLSPVFANAVRMSASDRRPAIRLQAASALLRLGDSAIARQTYEGLLTATETNIRFAAARALADIGDTAAVPILRGFLVDSLFSRRIDAARALGILGPKARSAAGELTAMLADSTPRPVAQGQALETESGAPYAAWALAQIFPFRSTASNVVIDPQHAYVRSSGNSLRDDGLGVYAWGVDSVAVFKASGLFLLLAPSAVAARGPIGPEAPGFRRSLTFDLSQPVPRGGGKPLGPVRDKEAYIWIWYHRDPATDRVTTVREIAASDSVHKIERIEMHFRVNGVLHELQMGPFVEGQGGAGIWYTGVHGNGTSLGELVHPSPDLWIVRAPKGSAARLWSFENRAKPIDRGLYYFSLDIRFADLPGGPKGACVPYPASCAQLRP